MEGNYVTPAVRRRTAVMASIGLALVYILIVVQTMMAQGGGPSDSTGLLTQGNGRSYMPVVLKPLAPLVLNPVGRPNSANQWNVSWNSGGAGVTQYELQEANDPDFTANVTNYSPGTATSYLVNTHAPSLNNIYYYRVRAIVGGLTGPWSNVQSVRGGWRDDFSDPNSGWAMRRTTYLELTNGYYKDNVYTIVVDDRWDWVIYSPLIPAPEPPYVIEYYARLHDASNLVSHGVAYGGDWNGQPCPDYSSFDGIYKHQICFNHFYNNNYIWYGPLKMVFERVDFLYWCDDVPKCDGDPPLKRALGYSYEDNVLAEDPGNWHLWRVEVRPDGIKLYVDGHLFSQNSDTMWVHEPYFGLFASTNEYKPSILITDWFQVLYLDE
jgi:hypothetical protein